LGLAYTISKFTFDEMLKTVDNISSPNEKLRLVSKISRDILQLDQIQRSQLLLPKDRSLPADRAYPSYINDSETVLASLDSLKTLYSSSPIQSQRIDSISELLKRRNELFLSYVQVRKSLIDNSILNDQIHNINELIRSTPENESKLVTTQRTIKTTITNNINQEEQEKDDRGFLAKFFGSKRKQEPVKQESAPQKTVHEELSIHVDTIKTKPENANKIKINQAIQHLEKKQIQQNSIFINRETELTIAGNILVNNMMDILYEVEAEVKNQMGLDAKNAKIVVNKSVSKISYILVISFLIMSVLIYLILNDIRKATSHRRALEKSKEEAEYHNAAKQRFLSNMSHEFRTPLQSIIGYTEQLQKSSEYDSKIDVIHHASEHLLQIVNEVLDYNRIISGKFIFHQETVLLTKLVSDVTQAMKQHADNKHLTLKVDEQIEGSGYVLADPFRLKQILFNLLSNAIKFTNEGIITIAVKATESGDKTAVEFSITDTGIGIPDRDIKLIFNEFEQGRSHNSGENFGSGLGLSIVKTLVDGMGGEIKVQSSVNKGSCFSVQFSLLSSDKIDLVIKKNKKYIDQHSIVNKVWVVDDDSFILELCATILTNRNIPHKVFSSPQALLDEPIDDQLSHVLMDMRMPGLSGKELSNILRKRINKSVKIIAFTAQALAEERSKILSEGFDGLLIKPFREAEFFEVLGIDTIGPLQNVSTEVDLGILPFIYEDPQELNQIITLFIKDTLDDLMNLKAAVKKENAVDAEIILHRLAGRSAQLGQEKIAFNLRKCEIDTRNGEITPLSEINKIETQLLYFIDFLMDKEKITL
jgi:signal transduction histidine kinase/CheY-like chemotaxis protein